MLKNLRQNNKGYTIAELMVSIAIFMVIAMLALANYRGSDQKEQVRLGAMDLASVIRKAQFLSFTGRTVDLGNGVTDVPPGGYGIYLEACTVRPCKYRLFADKDGELDYDGVSEDILNEIHTLPPQVVIEGILPIAPVAIVFKPPAPFVCVNRDCSNTRYTTITLKNAAKDDERFQVIVNQETTQVSVNEL